MASAAAFGTSGTFAKSLTDAGWTPGTAVTARVVLAAVVLTVPGLLSMRGRWRTLVRSPRLLTTVLVYGVASVAGCQLAFFMGIQYVSVGVALLLEYLSPLILMGVTWAVTRRRPAASSLAGAAVAVAGLFVVLDVVSGARVSATGVAWGLVAASCVATYFHISGHGADDLPPLALTWLGLAIGGATLSLGGWSGLLPAGAATADVTLGGTRLPFWISVAGMACIATVVAYATGVVATRRLGAALASFVGMAEVLFTILFAWLLLGEAMGPTQLLGGVVMLAGVLLVQRGLEADDEPAAGPTPA